MVVATDRSKIHRKTLPSESTLDEGKRTTFLVRTLSRRERTALMAVFSKYVKFAGDGDVDDISDVDLEALVEEIAGEVAKGLAGWENLPREDGKPATWVNTDEGGVTLDSLEWADDPHQLIEILGVIMEANKLGSFAKKGS